jgi:hypothetical protein
MCRKQKLCLGYPASIGTAVPAFYFSLLFWGWVLYNKDHYKLSSRLFPFSLSLFGFFLSRLQEN